MDKKLIAIGVEDKNKMWEDHFGESPYFDLYNLEGKLVETRLNPFGENGTEIKEHGTPHQILDLLSDCSVFIGCSLGKAKKIREMGFEAILTKETDPKAALAAYLKK